jgi:hypothetical protein
MSPSEQELRRLARRIHWLDRYRRPLSVALAFVTACILMWRFTGWLPSDWPGAHTVAMTVALSIFAWYAIEIVLGFTLALWETDFARLTRRPTLPRAFVVVRRK